VLGRDALKERLTHAKDQRVDAETKLAAIQQEVERQKAIIQELQASATAVPAASVELLTQASQANVAVTTSLADVARVITDMGVTLDLAPGRYTVMTPPRRNPRE
jgi:predicted  nucleic acid-binding Zn-ribbon protein